MVLIDFGSFSHLLEKYELFIKLSKTVIFGHFWAKSMGYSPWFWSILGHFHTFWKNMNYLWKLSKTVIFGHFWAKSMGYSPWFWSILGHFHTFWKNMNYLWSFQKQSFLAIFEQKAWAIAHGFDRFWVIFTPFLFNFQKQKKKHGL